MFDLDSGCTPMCKQTWRAATFKRIWGIGRKTLHPFGKRKKKKKEKKIPLIAFKAASQPRLEQIRVVTTCVFFFVVSTVNIWSASLTSFLYQCVFWWDDRYFFFLTLAARRIERLSDPNDSLLTIVYNFSLIFFLSIFYKFMSSKDITSSNISSQNIIGNPSVTISSGYYVQFYLY